MGGRRRAQAGDAVGRTGAESRGKQVGVVGRHGAGVVTTAQVLVHYPPVEQAAASDELGRCVALALWHVRRGRPRKQPSHGGADGSADLPAELGALLEARPERGCRQLKRRERQLERHEAGVLDAQLGVDADEAREAGECEQDGKDAPRGDSKEHPEQQSVVAAR
eukprot:2569573-Prymnesium_polylepis.1